MDRPRIAVSITDVASISSLGPLPQGARGRRAVLDASISRRGFTIIEVVVATVLISGLLVVVAQAMAVVAQQRRASQYRLIATEEAANLMELMMAHSYDRLTPEVVDSTKQSGPTLGALPAASLRVELVPMDAAPRSKRVTVEIAWTTPGGGKTKPVRVVAWKYDLEGQTP